ncbi:MAG: CHASE2 domain-containing protein [Candidatus Poribacteria bacterium]
MTGSLSKRFSNCKPKTSSAMSGASRPYAKPIGVCIVSLLTFLCIFVVSLFETLEFLELRTLDLRALWFLPKRAKTISPKLELITIDKESETDQELELGQWHTWPHSIFGSLIDALRDSKGSAIGILLWFIYEDTTDESLRAAIAESPNPVYLESTYKELRFPRKGIPQIKKDYWHDIPSGLEEAARATGIIEIPAGRDGFYRWAQMVVKDERDGQYKYSLAVRMLSDHLGLNHIRLQNSFWGGYHLLLQNESGKKRLRIPLDKQGRMLITFRGEDVRQFFHAHLVDVLKSHPEQAMLMDINPPIENFAQRYSDKLILVGMALPNYEVRSLTPRGEMPDLLIHANLLNTLLNQSFIERWSKPANGLYLFFIAMSAAGLFIIWETTIPKSHLWLPLLGAGLFLAHCGFAIGAFKSLGLWVDFVNPALVIGISSVVTLVYLMYIHLRDYAYILAENFNKLTKTYHEDIKGEKPVNENETQNNPALERGEGLATIEQETQRILAMLRTDYTRLMEANEYLGRIYREQENFISVISHEFRSPVESLKLTIENLLGGIYGELPPQSAEQMEKLLEQSEELGNLFERILYIGRLEIGKLQPTFSRVMLDVAIENVLESFRAQASNANIALKTRIPEEFPIIFADEDAIRHILENLLSNAIKFTNPSGTVTVELKDISEDFVEIRIQDTGCGIPADKIPLVFEKYYRSQEHKTKGTGLGLAIVKRLIELHHGEIDVFSDESVGSTFIVTLPKNPKSRGERSER